VTWVGLKTGRRKTGRANLDTFLDITFVLLELFNTKITKVLQGSQPVLSSTRHKMTNNVQGSLKVYKYTGEIEAGLQ
jgi:hypothetical protein